MREETSDALMWMETAGILAANRQAILKQANLYFEGWTKRRSILKRMHIFKRMHIEMIEYFNFWYDRCVPFLDRDKTYSLHCRKAGVETLTSALMKNISSKHSQPFSQFRFDCQHFMPWFQADLLAQILGNEAAKIYIQDSHDADTASH